MTETTPDTQAEDSKVLTRKAYSQATSRLREAHRDEFNQYMAEEATKLGFEWSPRLSPQEKALKDVQAILAEHPDLADRVRQMVG
jgi:hypothetical protein